MSDNLHLLPSISTPEERIQARIESFKRDLMEADGSVEQVEIMLGVILDYMEQYAGEDPTFDQAYLKLNECFFWFSSYANGI